MDVFEAMGTAVSMRWIKPDPVPDELVEQVLWAATRASNPGNSQPWDFVVVRDEATRHELAELITSRFGNLGGAADAPLPEDPTSRRMLEGIRYLIAHLQDAPVLIFVCGNNVYPPGRPQELMMYSGVFGATQNLIVAARALGLGAAYTTFQMAGEAEIKAKLGMPESTAICATIPLGWPGRRFGPLNRKPLEEVVHYDRW